MEDDNELLIRQWPPQSPDVNPADHRWDVVEQEVLIEPAQQSCSNFLTLSHECHSWTDNLFKGCDTKIYFPLYNLMTLWGKIALFTGSKAASINCLMKEPSHYKCHQSEEGETFGRMRAVLHLIHWWTVAAACERQVPASTSAGKTDLLAWFCSDDVSKTTWQ